MLRLSVPARQALARLALPLMLLSALALVLAGQADRDLGMRLRIALDDGLAPLYAAAALPLEALDQGAEEAGGWFHLHGENEQLRIDNERLRRWRAVALTLEAQNEALKSELHFIPSPQPDFFTAKVIADVGGLYARSVLAAIPPDISVLDNAVAMDGSGLVGRVVDVGERSARILLITDINSRIPVSLGAQGGRALMIGTNGDCPGLVYWSPGSAPREGAVVVTSALGGMFPAGLPVGTVHYTARNNSVVVPFARLDRLRLIRLFEYGGSTGLSADGGRSHLASPELTALAGRS